MNTRTDPQVTENLYHRLLKGLDHDQVTEDNIDALIRRADVSGGPLGRAGFIHSF